MKLFGSGRFDKVGKGIEKDEKPKKPIVRFFEILWLKKYSLIGLNMLYVLFNLIMIALVCVVLHFAVAFYGFLLYRDGAWLTNLMNGPSAGIYYRYIVFFAIMLTSVPIFAIGPFQAGFTYVIKSFVKREPCFVWTDFITKARSNKSLSLKLGLFNAAVGTLLIANISAFFVVTAPNGPYAGMLSSVMQFFVALVIFGFCALLLMMNLYMYQMMVSFKVTFRQLLKNSFILVLVKWLPNIGILLLESALVLIPLLLIQTPYFAYVVTILLYIFITPALFGFINNFYVYPTLKKYLLDNPSADKSASESLPDGNTDAEKPKGRFENGMWIEE